MGEDGFLLQIELWRATQVPKQLYSAINRTQFLPPSHRGEGEMGMSYAATGLSPLLHSNAGLVLSPRRGLSCIPSSPPSDNNLLMLSGYIRAAQRKRANEKAGHMFILVSQCRRRPAVLVVPPCAPGETPRAYRAFIKACWIRTMDTLCQPG
jgi:hypothetical protein